MSNIQSLHLFYTPDISGDYYTLNEEESRHCLKVLRLRTGDIIHLTDGKGNLWEARITGEHTKKCTVQVHENLAAAKPGTDIRFPWEKEQTANGKRQTAYGLRPYRLHIAIAPTKSIERFEWFLEKATEIGIDEITPLICDHSERRHLRIDRLEKVMTAAVKQSLKAWHPRLNNPVSLSDFIQRPLEIQKFIAYYEENAPMLHQICKKKSDAIIMIGPEGDFSDAEVRNSLQEGYQVITLGDYRLRTETAGVLACHSIYLMNLAD